MTHDRTGQITSLLHRLSRGDKSAEAELVQNVYQELKRMAASYLRHERPGHTLQATALVNEAYLRLVGKRIIEWEDRSHFFSVAARVMRRILVDYSRHRKARKRGGLVEKISLDEAIIVGDNQCRIVAALDEALKRLEELDPRQAKVVELRYFAGLSEEDIAKLLGISSRTVKRDWVTAKAWLYGELSS